MIVLDTNVVSELMRTSPAEPVVAWLWRQRAGSLVTTAITAAEIRYGLARLPAGRRRGALVEAAAGVLGSFSGQVWPFNGEAASVYGDVAAGRERVGRPIDGIDAQIAAICVARDARLATRNTGDFDGTGVRALDPWQE